MKLVRVCLIDCATLRTASADQTHSRRSVCLVGTAGLIYAAIVIAWLAYLVPLYLRRHKVEVSRPAIRPPDARVWDSAGRRTLGAAASGGLLRVRSALGGRDAAATDDSEVADPEGPDGSAVSTLLSRRAEAARLRELEWRAARRRRNVLTGLMGAVSVIVILSVAKVLPGWTLVIPVSLVIGFFVVARVSVVYLRRDLDRRYAALFSGAEESTGPVDSEPRQQVRDSAAIEGVALGVPDDHGGQLWDPLPITAATYISQPVVGRSVRTIDLATPATAPAATDDQDRPVTADEPTQELASDELPDADDRPRASGA